MRLSCLAPRGVAGVSSIRGEADGSLHLSPALPSGGALPIGHAREVGAGLWSSAPGKEPSVSLQPDLALTPP